MLSNTARQPRPRCRLGVATVSFFVLTATFAGCGLSVEELSDLDDEGEPSQVALAQQFGDALLKSDYAAAYALTSTQFQQGTPLDKFTSDHQADEKEYHQFGRPKQVEASLGFDDAESLAEEDFPAEIPTEKRLAWMHATFGIEIDEEGNFERCYTCGMLIVEDGGQKRIGHYEYFWCD